MIQYFEIDSKVTEYFIQSPPDIRQKEYHEIMWVQGGNTDFTIDGDKFNIEANGFFILPKDRYNQFLPQKPIIGQVIRFTEEFLNHFPRLLFSKFNHLAEVKIDQKENLVFEKLFDVFRMEYNTVTKNQKVLVNLLQSILCKLDEIKCRQLTGITHNQSTDLIDRLQLLFDVHITQHRSVQFYANLLHITPRQLGKAIKVTFNHTTENLISQRLLIEVKRELVYGDKTFTQIAYDLNFQDSSYFTKFFKKYTKMTPKEFRKNSLSAK